MWRVAYQAHTQVCSETTAWLLAQDVLVDVDCEPLRRYAESWERVRHLLRRRRGPRLVAEAFDRTLSDVLDDMRRAGSFVPSLARAAGLDSCLTTMTAYSLFRPWIMVPAMVTPLVVPAVVLVGFPSASRAAMASLPPQTYFMLVVAGIVANATLVYRILQRFIDRPHLFGPYSFWAVPPALASFVILFALARPGLLDSLAVTWRLHEHGDQPRRCRLFLADDVHDDRFR